MAHAHAVTACCQHHASPASIAAPPPRRRRRRAPRLLWRHPHRAVVARRHSRRRRRGQVVDIGVATAATGTAAGCGHRRPRRLGHEALAVVLCGALLLALLGLLARDRRLLARLDHLPPLDAEAALEVGELRAPPLLRLVRRLPLAVVELVLTHLVTRHQLRDHRRRLAAERHRRETSPATAPPPAPRAPAPPPRGRRLRRPPAAAEALGILLEREQPLAVAVAVLGELPRQLDVLERRRLRCTVSMSSWHSAACADASSSLSRARAPPRTRARARARRAASTAAGAARARAPTAAAAAASRRARAARARARRGVLHARVEFARLVVEAEPRHQSPLRLQLLERLERVGGGLDSLSDGESAAFDEEATRPPRRLARLLLLLRPEDGGRRLHLCSSGLRKIATRARTAASGSDAWLKAVCVRMLRCASSREAWSLGVVLDRVDRALLRREAELGALGAGRRCVPSRGRHALLMSTLVAALVRRGGRQDPCRRGRQARSLDPAFAASTRSSRRSSQRLRKRPLILAVAPHSLRCRNSRCTADRLRGNGGAG